MTNPKSGGLDPQPPRIDTYDAWDTQRAKKWFAIKVTLKMSISNFLHGTPEPKSDQDWPLHHRQTAFPLLPKPMLSLGKLRWCYCHSAARIFLQFPGAVRLLCLLINTLCLKPDIASLAVSTLCKGNMCMAILFVNDLNLDKGCKNMVIYQTWTQFLVCRPSPLIKYISKPFINEGGEKSVLDMLHNISLGIALFFVTW